MASPSEVWETPRKTYSEASATFADSVHARGAGVGGGAATLPRDGIPSASAGAMSSAAASNAAPPKHPD